jgi:hypothetical protein
MSSDSRVPFCVVPARGSSMFTTDSHIPRAGNFCSRPFVLAVSVPLEDGDAGEKAVEEGPFPGMGSTFSSSSPVLCGVNPTRNRCASRLGLRVLRGP